MPAPTNPNAGQLDQTQILQRVFDESTDKLRVDSSISVNSITGEVSIELNASDGDNVAIANADGSKKASVTTVGSSNGLDVNIINTAVPIQDGGNSITVDGTVSISGSVAVTGPLTDLELRASAVPISAAALPLPTGAATSVLQTTGNSSLASIDSKLTSPLTVTGPLTDTQLRASAVPVSAATLPLPSGASTSALQTTGNTSLSSIDGKLGTLGQKAMTGSAPVVIASDQSTLPVSAASLPLPSGASTSALQTTGNASLASIDAGIPNALGAATTANSMPVNIASDQVVPVSATSLPLPTGAATAALQTQPGVDIGDVTVNNASGANAVNIQDGGNSITVDAASLPLPTGAATSALQTTGNTSLGLILANQTNATQKVQLVDGSGNVYGPADSDVDGENHLPVSLIQDINVTSGNSSTSNLASGATFTGTAADTTGVAAIQINFKASQRCRIAVHQSPDGTNWDYITTTYEVAANFGDSRVVNASGSYYRVLVTNLGSISTTYLRLQSITAPVMSPMPNTLSQEGRLLVDDGRATAAFGALMVAQIFPHVSLNPVHGLQERMYETYNSGTGSGVDVFDGAPGRELRVQTGTSVGGYGLIRSKKVLSYRPGIGSLARFTARFSAPVANSAQRVGLLNIGNELTFGYYEGSGSGQNFGILHRSGGRIQITTLTLNSRALAAQNVTVTLNGVASSPIALTNSTIEQNAREICAGFAGNTLWQCVNIGGTVVFTGESVGARSGAYTLTSTGAVTATFTQTQTGAAVTDSFIAQTAWNRDRFDGTGPSGVTLDPTKINVFQVRFQYLGAGNINFFIENPKTGRFDLCHVIEYPNSAARPSLDYPGFKLCLLAYSAGSTTNISTFSSSLAGFHENAITFPRKIHSEIKSQTGVTSTLTSIIAMKKTLFSNNLMDIRDIKVMDLGVSVDGTKNCIFKAILNPTFATPQLWAAFDEDTSVIISGTGGTVTGGEQVYCAALPKVGNLEISVADLDFIFSTDDVLALCVQTVSSTTDAVCSVTWGEE